jgi:hypothetical protein
MMIPSIGDQARRAIAVDKAWDQLQREETTDENAVMLCKFIITNARDARRDTARDILKLIEDRDDVRH